jgi:hypothetical protein
MTSNEIYRAMRNDTKTRSDLAALLRLTAECMRDVLGDAADAFHLQIEAGELENFADEIEDGEAV